MSDINDAIAECERKFENANRDLAALHRRRDPQAKLAATLVAGYERQLADLRRKRAEGQS